MKGKFKPDNPQKYKGDFNNIIYRSSWELKLMMKLDNDDNIIQWSSEETRIPYKSPIDGKRHLYYPDFYIKSKAKNGFKEGLIEVKPLKEVIGPSRININEVKKPIARRYVKEVVTFKINESKWAAAREYCDNRGWNFIIMTEKELGIR